MNNHKNSGGNTMSLKKSAKRRLSLLAGSSLIAASLATAAFTGAAMAPTVTFAADECTPVPPTLGNGAGPVSDDPTLNGATADSFECAATPYATGITYNSAGNLTVTKTNTGTTTVTANGVNLTGAGADSVTWDSSIGIVAGGAGTAGPVIDVTSVSGPISITTHGVTANQAGTTHGIRATSTGGGAITITRAIGGVNNNVAGGEAAIEAVTNGGAISITTAGATQGRVRGILAQTSGAGSVALNIAGNVTANNDGGVAAIDATAGTGGLNITFTSGSITGGTGGGLAIVGTSAGNAVITNNGATLGSINFNMPFGGGAVDFSGVAGNVTFTHAGATNTTGRWLGSGASVFGAGNDVLNFSGIGHNFLGGRGALAEASIDFGAGDDTLNLAAFLNMGGHTQDAGSIDFGAGNDTFNLSGVFTSHGGELANLEALNLSGTIFMGSGESGNNANSTVVVWTDTDGVTNDVLRVHGATFTGSGDARIAMDVDIGAGVQPGCETLTGVGDCLDLRGGTTAGTTLLTLNNLGADALQAGYDIVGITLVDVGGGTSAAGHFLLDPETTGLQTDPIYGDIIARPGLFSVVLRYDAETQRHVLISLPDGELMEYAVLSGAAQSIWHMTAETVTDRQMDLRRGTEGSMWLRGAGEYVKRDTSSSFAGVGETFTVDNSYKLYAGTVMGGMDLITGTSGGYDYALGAQIGYVSSSFDLDEAESSGRMTGATGGVYGSVWSSRFFLDGTFNANGLTLDHESPVLGARTNTYLNSIGARLDGGMRWMLGGRSFVEPLASVAFARTSFEEISLSGGEVQPANANSRRGALGLRLGADLTEGAINVGYFVVGRAWNEFAGDSSGVVHNPGTDLPFAEEFSGGFGEAEAGVNLFNDAGTLSGFLTSGVKFKDGYNATNLSLGLKMAW
jgi:hypothetical protein